MRVSSPHLVGRQKELARLVASLGGALSGAPALCLVGGEAGVGKSRLVRELEREAHARGALVLHGECADLVGDELPYAPLIAALRCAPDQVDRAMAAMPDTVRTELGRLVPSTNEFVSGGTIQGSPRRACSSCSSACCGGSPSMTASCSWSRICTGRTRRRGAF